MKFVPIRVAAGVAGLVALTAGLPQAAASAGPPTSSPTTTQTVGLDYSGFSCPLQPVLAVPDIDTTLALTTDTNFTSDAAFVIPSLHIRVPLPFTPTSTLRYVPLGPLRRGSIPFEIDAPPMTGSYGPSCHGVFAVGLTTNTA